MLDACFIIPSYARPEVLREAIIGIQKQIMAKSKLKIGLVVYLQVEGNVLQPGLNLPLSSMIMKDTSITAVQMEHRTIGSTLRNSVIRTQNIWRDSKVLLLSDDDILVTDDFNLDYFESIINHFINHNVMMGSAKIGRSIRYSEIFPNMHDFNLPFKEKFMLIKNDPELIKSVFSNELDHVEMGADLFVFLKGLLCGYYKMYNYYGLQGYYHIPFEGECLPVTGGYQALIEKNHGVSDENRHARMAKHPNSVLNRYKRFFDWANMNEKTPLNKNYYAIPVGLDADNNLVIL